MLLLRNPLAVGEVGRVDLPPEERRAEEPPKNARPWHPKRRGSDEPECAGNQWRTRDRYCVMNMADMEDRHLRHAIRFASTLPQHADRLGALLAEQSRRSQAKT